VLALRSEPVAGIFTETHSYVRPRQRVFELAHLHQAHNTLFFTAGPNKAANGLYGRIDLPLMLMRLSRSAGVDGCERAELALRSFFFSKVLVARSAIEHPAHA
jgi:hypothetical protein